MSTGVLFFLNMWAHNKCTQLENTKAATAKCNAIQYTNKNSYNCKPAPKKQTIMNNQKYIWYKIALKNNNLTNQS